MEDVTRPTETIAAASTAGADAPTAGAAGGADAPTAHAADRTTPVVSRGRKMPPPGDLLLYAVAILPLALRWLYLAAPRFFPFIHTAFSGHLPIPYSYDEATYADLALHPWHSSYYADPVFLRHPPLYFWSAWLWTKPFGNGETSLRFLSLLLTSAATVFLMRAIRFRSRVGALATTPSSGNGQVSGSSATASKGSPWPSIPAPSIPVVAALLWACSWPLHAYLLQATMYALAFLFLAVALDAQVRGEARRERWALILLCLTHLLGFAYLAVWLWRQAGHGTAAQRIRGLWKAGMRVWPAWTWLLVATILGFVLHNGSDLIGLGPGGQAVRSGSVLKDYLHGGAALHLGAVAMTILLAGPLLLLPAWRNRAALPVAVPAAVFLCAYFFVAPQFLRYAVLVAPVLLVAGLVPLLRRAPRLASVSLLAIALLTIPLTAAYLASGPDPSAANDVPGEYDIREAALLVDGHSRIATNLPTALAHYIAPAGTWNATDGPNRLILTAAPTPGNSVGLTIVRVGGPSADAIAATLADLYIIPERWNAHGDLMDRGFSACGHVQGLEVYARYACPDRPVVPQQT